MSAALLLAGAGLVACGSSAVNQRTAIVRVIRAREAAHGMSYVSVHRLRVSKLDPQYATAQVWDGG